MAIEYIEVTTVVCDICKQEADFVRHSDYDPQGIEWEVFTESLEEKGGILREGTNKTYVQNASM